MNTRLAALGALSDQTFDLAIVGGGITGAGIARDAALRGLKVALIEKVDFASGTSSKSSKLVHGGLRYLEQAEFKLVFESVNERKLLLERARHLVRPMPFLVPNYKGDRRWLVTLGLGLWIYEALCLFRTPKLHQTWGAAGTLQLEPGLKRDGLNGAISYSDCRTDDARLTLENVLDAQANGAVVLNHARAGALLAEGGRICGVKVHDGLGGGSLDVRATVVINATGPWSDEVRALAGDEGVLKPARGSHVVVDVQRLPVANALMMLNPVDARVVFAIPWGLGRTVIGTTDTFYEGPLDDVHADRADAEYLLATANHYFPDAKLEVRDVLATWSGLRPLIKPSNTAAGASAVSREHMLEAKQGFITIAGGKLTTYRRMAQEVVDVALEQLGGPRPHSTAKRPLPGSLGLTSDADLDARVAALEGFGKDIAQNLTLTYGVRGAEVTLRAQEDNSALDRLDPELPYIWAQIDEAVDNELAATLDDVLSRRVPMLLRGRDQGLAIAEPVSRRLAQKLGWDEARRQAELEGYRAVVARSRRFREDAVRADPAPAAVPQPAT